MLCSFNCWTSCVHVALFLSVKVDSTAQTSFRSFFRQIGQASVMVRCKKACFIMHHLSCQSYFLCIVIWWMGLSIKSCILIECLMWFERKVKSVWSSSLWANFPLFSCVFLHTHIHACTDTGMHVHARAHALTHTHTHTEVYLVAHKWLLPLTVEMIPPFGGCGIDFSANAAPTKLLDFSFSYSH